MAAAVMPNPKVAPFHMASHQRNQPVLHPPASSSRPPQQLPSPELSTSSSISPEASSKAFYRLRSSLEQSIRTATRSKKSAHPSADDFGTVTPSNHKGKEKEKRIPLEEVRKHKPEACCGDWTPSSSKAADPHDMVRQAGFTSFITPSLRGASMSSPALHLSSQTPSSPKSQSVVPASSSSTVDVLASPTRERMRRTTLQLQQPKEISSPLPLGAKQDARGGPHAPSSSRQGAAAAAVASSSRHRMTKSNPLNQVSTSAEGARAATPTGTSGKNKTKELPSPPDTPSHSPSSTTRTPSPPKAASTNSPPSTPRATSPLRARSPTSRGVRVVSPPPKLPSSSSASHLPLSSSPPPARRPSIDQRRPSMDAPRRPSIDSPHRPSIDSPRRPIYDDDRPDSPSPIRRRPTSPQQRSYSQNRHYNISSASLVPPPTNPEHREQIRTASSLLCKEVVKPPLHMSRTEAGMKDWKEVELRTQKLARLERIWGKSGAIGSMSASNVSTSGLSSPGIGTSGEERERKLFCEALRDGLMNKLRASNVVKPDPKEDGRRRHRIQQDSWRPAPPIPWRVCANYHRAGQKSPAPITTNPYGGTISRASASTPNLHPLSTSPTPTSPMRKRYSPPAALPPVRSDSPEGKDTQGRGQEAKEVAVPVPSPRIMTPPPRSPLRPRLKRSSDGGLGEWANSSASVMRVSVADSTAASVGEASLRDSVADCPPIGYRQSVASSAMTDNTVTTVVSSILDSPRNMNGGNSKFGTIRTVTTDLTSEMPSMTRTEGSAIAEDMARKRSTDFSPRPSRERKASGAAVVDLSRVAEETDESVSSKGRSRHNPKSKSVEEKPHAVHLGKGKWPDDFLDVFQKPSQARPIPTQSTSRDEEDDVFGSSSNITARSISPPKKLAITEAGRRNESPRRPTHRARHSVDAPVLAPRDSLLRRDASPDGALSSSPGRGVMLRRHSTKPNMTYRNGVYVPRNNLDDARDSDGDSRVPFPRTNSIEHASGSPHSSTCEPTPVPNERPRLRGRFQSDIEGSTAKRNRPSSYDDLGTKPLRSRFESMVNLGGQDSGTPSASDLMPRNPVDGHAVRKILVVREDGKPPTHFQLGNCIGRGQFGTVYRALNLNTGQTVAVKRIRLEGLKEDEINTLMREVDLVKSLSHPSIVKYEGMARDNDTLSIVLEYAENGSLGQTLKAFGKLNERLVASYVVKILEGLHYLHGCDVVHCDLKAANILTTKNGNVKLSDFGVSLNLRAMGLETKDVAGTPNWMAPEVIELKGASTKSDIWSLACTVIELLTGKPPYSEISNTMTVMFRIVEDDIPPLPENCSPPLEDFLTQCFNKEPARRPSAEELCEHPWLKMNWVELKDLRPQDSIPFLRRVSADVQKMDVVKYITQFDMTNSPTSEVGSRSPPVSPISPSTPNNDRRISDASIKALDNNDISPREHSFVKTTFSKPMVCRVCLLNVKKSAVLCAQCSLISHSKCAVNAPPTCDLRAQLLLYAQYAEKGNPASVYSNPIDRTRDNHPAAPMSDVPYVAHTPRTSIDSPSPHASAHPSPNPVHPPTAFKFMAAFKRSRSRSNLTPEPGMASSTSLQTTATNDRDDKGPVRRPTVLQKHPKERPLSVTSDSTGISSLRSVATAAESLSSRHERGGSLSVPDSGNGTSGSAFSSVGDSSHNRPSKVTFSASPPLVEPDEHRSNSTSVPGGLPTDTRRQKRRNSDSKSSGGCVVQ
ncbi:hypothetical protein BDQ17DRAFT_1423841 [Cyathus striatus]|nr:hypothetical protein BDQ17DRAFT_1423841 [Cyathus striatus]